MIDCGEREVNAKRSPRGEIVCGVGGGWAWVAECELSHKKKKRRLDRHEKVFVSGPQELKGQDDLSSHELTGK